MVSDRGFGGAQPRLEEVAKDLIEHYETRSKATRKSIGCWDE